MCLKCLNVNLLNNSDQPLGIDEFISWWNWFQNTLSSTLDLDTSYLAAVVGSLPDEYGRFPEDPKGDILEKYDPTKIDPDKVLSRRRKDKSPKKAQEKMPFNFDIFENKEHQFDAMVSAFSSVLPTAISSPSDAHTFFMGCFDVDLSFW